MSVSDHLVIFDTTLRDGEQSPGASMTKAEKLRIAKTLEKMKVDVIEAGFAIASQGDFESVKAIAESIKDSRICSLARALDKDIDRAAEALKNANASRIHTFIATSPIHMQYKLQMQPDDVVEQAVKAVKRARNYTDDVEFSCEDAGRSELEFLCRIIEAAIDAGATTINIPDTVGYAIPRQFGTLINDLIKNIPNADKAIFSVHCHNDLGLAVGNSLEAVLNGARQIECTINGLGERAGNAALEEVVMGMDTRSDVLPYWTNIDPVHITKASRLVSAVSGFPVQYNKAIVGQNAFAHESGIHQDGMLKNNQTYEIMTPESVGLRASSLVMGKHSGRHAFKEKLKDLGYELGDNAFQEAFQRFKDLADKKKQVFDEDLIALVDDEVSSENAPIKLVSLTVYAGTGGPQKATVTLDVEGEEKTRESGGDGPVDAIFNAIRDIVPHDARLPLYQVMAVTEGTDAQADVMVRLEQDGFTSTGRSADTDTMVASARAYIGALNGMIERQGKAVGSQLDAI